MGWKLVGPGKAHSCDMPHFVGEGVEQYDIIQCDCGQRWKCTGTDYGMQWDPFPRGVLRWERV